MTILTKLELAAVGLVVASCAFGGGEGDPTNGLRPTDAGPAIDASRMDATVALDATMRTDSGARDAATPPLDASAPQVCEPATPPAVCDPVKNTDCPPLTQCEIDPEATEPSGRCVFWNVQLGDTCSSDGLNTTCEGPDSCVDGACRKPCYCDADCAGDAGAGACCREAAPGPAGPVKLCGPC